MKKAKYKGYLIEFILNPGSNISYTIWDNWIICLHTAGFITREDAFNAAKNIIDEFEC